MKEETSSQRRTLAHLERLRRDGGAILKNRPLDEIAHLMWLNRVEKYVGRTMPDVTILPPDQLVPVRMPDLLDAHRKRPHPMDAAIARSEGGLELIRKYLAILASAIERLELRLESEGNRKAEQPPA